MNKASSQKFSQHEKEQIITALEHILTSKPFAKAKKQQALLSYIVHAAINGQEHKINGYNIAVEVFERPKDFDPQTDTVVRVAAGRLRTKLDAYYQTPNQTSSITIALPVRSYVPKITIAQAPKIQVQLPQQQSQTTHNVQLALKHKEQEPSEQCQRKIQIKKLISSSVKNLTLVMLIAIYINLTQTTCSGKRQQSTSIASSEAQIQQMEAQLAKQSLELATQYQLKEEYVNASIHYQKAANAEPQNSDTWRLLGKTHLTLAQYAKAKQAFDQAQAIDKQTKPALISLNASYLGHYYRKTRQYQKAIDLYQQTLNEYQTTPVVNADIHRGIALAQSFLAQHPQASYAISTAFKQFEQVTNNQPELLLKLHSSRGIIKKRQGQHLEAIVDFVKAKALASQHFGVNHTKVAEQRALLAMMYSRTNQYQQAIDEYTQAIAVISKVFGPEHSKVARLYNNITNPLIKQQRYQQASDYLQKALTINSKTIDKYPISYALNLYNLGLVHQQLEQYPIALGYLRQSLTYYVEAFGEAHPEVGEIWQVMAEVATKMNDTSNARYFYQKALIVFENSEEPSANKIETIKSQLTNLKDG